MAGLDPRKVDAQQRKNPTKWAEPREDPGLPLGNMFGAETWQQHPTESSTLDQEQPSPSSCNQEWSGGEPLFKPKPLLWDQWPPLYHRLCDASPASGTLEFSVMADNCHVEAGECSPCYTYYPHLLATLASKRPIDQFPARHSKDLCACCSLPPEGVIGKSSREDSRPVV